MMKNDEMSVAANFADYKIDLQNKIWEKETIIVNLGFFKLLFLIVEAVIIPYTRQRPSCNEDLFVQILR